MGKFSRLGNSLYEGTVSIDFVGRAKQWYAISAVIFVVAIGALIFKPLNLGIEFEGGVEYRIAAPANQVTDEGATQLREAIIDTGVENSSDPQVNTSGTDTLRVQVQPLTPDESDQVVAAIQEQTGVQAQAISQDQIGATWGSQVLNRALTGMIVFLIAVSVFIWFYFREWKMSVAALVALAHDVLITVGVYALSGFEVTPATVTGVLTILGFSLYDTVVVFDKVNENVKIGRKRGWSYRYAANLAVNQTLVRSVNTSLVALLPIGAILGIGVYVLGSGSLKDLALSLFVGMAAGTYSSVFIATPLLVQLKMREPEVVDADRRQLSKLQRADRYATVPTYADNMPVPDERDVRELDDDFEGDQLNEFADPNAGTPGGGRRPAGGVMPRRQTHEEPMGRGRVQPEQQRPVQDSGAAGRNQPKRSSRDSRRRDR